MDNSIISLEKPGAPGKKAENILKILTAYPAFWTLGILLAGLLKSHSLIMVIMFTWVLAFYFGILLWLGLAIFLLVKKRISFKKVIFHFLIASAGIVSGCFVAEYDVFGSGVKYID
jgi:hypothetical protein